MGYLEDELWSYLSLGYAQFYSLADRHEMMLQHPDLSDGDVAWRSTPLYYVLENHDCRFAPFKYECIFGYCWKLSDALHRYKWPAQFFFFLCDHGYDHTLLGYDFYTYRSYAVAYDYQEMFDNLEIVEESEG